MMRSMLLRPSTCCLATVSNRGLTSYKKNINDKLMFEKDGTRVYAMAARHIPLILPMVRQFLIDEPNGAGLDLQFDDAYVWPFLFNCTRYETSLFAVRDNKLAGFAMNDIVFRDPAKDPLPLAEMPTYPKDHPMTSLNNMLNWADKRAFELKPQHQQMLLLSVAFVESDFRGKNIYNIMASPILSDPNLKDYLSSQGVTTGYGVATGRISQPSMLGFSQAELLDQVPSSLYVKPDGTPFKPRDGSANAKLFAWNLNKGSSYPEKRAKKAEKTK